MKSTISLILCLLLVNLGKASNIWSVTATAADTGKYYHCFVGNGILGITSKKEGLSARELYINGMYDAKPGGYKQICYDYNPMVVRVNVKSEGEVGFDQKVSNWSQTLKMKEGILYTEYSYANKIHIHNSMMALRNIPNSALNLIEITALQDVELNLVNDIEIPDRSDVSGIYKTSMSYRKQALSSFSHDSVFFMTTVLPQLSGKGCIAGANTCFFSRKPESFTYQKFSAVHQSTDCKVVLKKGQKFTYCLVSSVTHNGFTDDPLTDAIRTCGRNHDKGYNYLIEQHKIKWAEMWQSDIVIEGDDEAQRDARLALYSIYSSIAEGFNLSIPPCGISGVGWGGHIFWDADIWMFPPLLVLHPELAYSMMQFRLNTLPQCRKRAALYGYKGAMFPWESDMEGNENTPVEYKIDMNELHVTADVGIAAWNYFCATRDTLWLKDKGYQLIKDVADFWASKAELGTDGKYHINNVIGANEYAEDINDNAYTNGAAITCLQNAGKASCILKYLANPFWKDVSSKIAFHYAPEGHTLENSTYNGQIIKQADVNLLAYPLSIVTYKDQIIKDLEFYEPRIDPNGPSMSNSVLAIIYARLGYSRKALEQFHKAYIPNQKPPFFLINESPTSTNRIFCTGYGGILQALIFGFGGMQLNDEGLNQTKGCLPEKWKSLTIKRLGNPDVVVRQK